MVSGLVLAGYVVGGVVVKPLVGRQGSSAYVVSAGGVCGEKRMVPFSRTFGTLPDGI